MANGYDVQHDAMAKGATAVDEAAGQITTIIQTLNRQVDDMFSPGWAGRAQLSFHNLRQAWVDQQTKLQTALVDMHSALVATNTSYLAQEEHGVAAFNQIQGAL
jgi:WXG100 family type VII secretion target